MATIIIKGMNDEIYRAFKAECAKRGVTIKDAIQFAIVSCPDWLDGFYVAKKEKKS